jgi:hypothetical protein
MATTKIDTTNVTSEQIERCTRCIDLNGEKPEPFYLVQSESDDLTEYAVRYHKLPTPHFSCMCKSGQNGFANCKDGVCKHVKWSCAAADEYKAEQAALAERDAKREADAAKLAKIRRLVEKGLTHEQALLAADNHESVSDDELLRVYGKPAKKVTGKGRTDLRTFSLMR